ncbi:755_t:CDS:2, partial [Ambispora leptoticha]
MSKLVPDVLLEIFRYLINKRNNVSSNHGKDLFHCLLVNRTWCNVAVPLLWSDPFTETSRFVTNVDNMIFSTLISCLPTTKMQELENDGIHIKKIKYEFAAFQYTRFLRSLNFSKLLGITKECVTKQSNIINNNMIITITIDNLDVITSMNKIIRALLFLFNEYSLSMTSIVLKNNHKAYSNYIDLLLEPDFELLRARIKEVKELQVRSGSLQLLSNMGNQHLKIRLKPFKQNISQLAYSRNLTQIAQFISSQRSLYSLNFGTIDYKSNYQHIIDSLLPHQSTLESLEFHGIEFNKTPPLRTL